MLPDQPADELESYERILLQLRSEEGLPFSARSGFPPQERYPDLHERQIEENNLAWAYEREGRVEGHCERVRVELRHCSRARRPGEATNGTRQKVWCVELRQCFDSLSQAARLAGRAPSNVLQSIRFGYRCGAFHWERFDPARHHPDTPSERTAGAESLGADRAAKGQPHRPPSFAQ